MNSCKVILAQSKSMKSTCLTTRGIGVGRVRFQGAKKLPVKGEELSDLVDNTLKAVLKPNKRKKSMASSVPPTASQALTHSRLTLRACQPWRHFHDYMTHAYFVPFISYCMSHAYRAPFISTTQPRAYRASFISMTQHTLEYSIIILISTLCYLYEHL